MKEDLKEDSSDNEDIIEDSLSESVDVENVKKIKTKVFPKKAILQVNEDKVCSKTKRKIGEMCVFGGKPLKAYRSLINHQNDWQIEGTYLCITCVVIFLIERQAD